MEEASNKEAKNATATQRKQEAIRARVRMARRARPVIDARGLDT